MGSALRCLLVAAAGLALAPTGASADAVVDRDLDSGTRLRLADVRETTLPRPSVPDGAVRDAHDVVGGITSGALRRGEVLTDRRTVRAGRLDGFGPGRVLAVVRVADPSVLSMLRPGDRVDVVAVSGDGHGKAAGAAPDAPRPA